MHEIVTFWTGLLDNKTFLHVLLAWLDTVFPVYVFVVCSKFKFKEVGRELAANRWVMLRVVLLGVLGIPLATAGIVKLLDVSIMLGGIMLIASTAPGDPFDLVEAHGKKGGLMMAAITMLILVLVMPFIVPCWMWVFSRWFPLHLSVAPAGVFHAVAPKVLPPLLIGLILRETLPRLADVLAKVLHSYFKISAILITVYFLPFAVAKMLAFGVNGYIAMFLVTTMTLFAGYYSCEVSRKDRISIALTVSLGNMAAVLFVAHQCYPKLNMIDFLMTVFGWIILRWIYIWVWYFYLKLRVGTP